jgi:hypothetical protein
MIAYAAAGDGPGAEAFWQRFGPAWIDQKKEDFIYQFLLQFAQSRPEIRG